MSWTRYFFQNMFTAADLNQMDSRLESQGRSFMHMATTTTRRVSAVEDDLGRLALLARALADVCVQKGLVSKDELATMMMKIDLEDGVEDGKVSRKPPKKLPPTRNRR